MTWHGRPRRKPSLDVHYSKCGEPVACGIDRYGVPLTPLWEFVTCKACRKRQPKRRRR